MDDLKLAELLESSDSGLGIAITNHPPLATLEEELATRTKKKLAELDMVILWDIQIGNEWLFLFLQRENLTVTKRYEENICQPVNITTDRDVISIHRLVVGANQTDWDDEIESPDAKALLLALDAIEAPWEEIKNLGDYTDYFRGNF